MSETYKLPNGEIADRLGVQHARLPDVLALVRTSFAYMDARIDPPSSMHALDLDALDAHCNLGEIWCVGAAPDACVFLTPQDSALYVGKLAVAEACRGRGLARHLIALAEARALALGYNALELEVRVELVENQAVFAKLGFLQTGTSSHAGYDRPTSVTMRCMVPLTVASTTAGQR